MARNKHSRSSQDSKKEASLPSSPPTQSPNTTVNQQAPRNYMDSLLCEAERAKRYERVATQQAQIAQVEGNPDYQEKLKDLEKKTPGMMHRFSGWYHVDWLFADINGGLNEAAINEWEAFIFKKRGERDNDDEDADLEDYLWIGSVYFTTVNFRKIRYCLASQSVLLTSSIWLHDTFY